MNPVVFSILVIATVILNTVAQTLLKLGSGSLLNPQLLGGLIVYGISTIVYLLILGKSNLSIIYPMVIGLTVMATTVSGGVILGEKIVLTQWIGIGLMISGIFAVVLK